MFKLLIFALMAVILYRVLWFGKGVASKTDHQDKPESMVTCAICGIHFPEHEAVLGDDRIFCSKSHRDTWKQGH